MVACPFDPLSFTAWSQPYDGKDCRGEADDGKDSDETAVICPQLMVLGALNVFGIDWGLSEIRNHHGNGRYRSFGFLGNGQVHGPAKPFPWIPRFRKENTALIFSPDSILRIRRGACMIRLWEQCRIETSTVASAFATLATNVRSLITSPNEQFR